MAAAGGRAGRPAELLDARAKMKAPTEYRKKCPSLRYQWVEGVGKGSGYPGSRSLYRPQSLFCRK